MARNNQFHEEHEYHPMGASELDLESDIDGQRLTDKESYKVHVLEHIEIMDDDGEEDGEEIGLYKRDWHANKASRLLNQESYMLNLGGGEKYDHDNPVPESYWDSKEAENYSDIEFEKKEE